MTHPLHFLKEENASLRQQLTTKSSELQQLKFDYEQLMDTVNAQHEALDTAVRQLEHFTHNYKPWMDEKKDMEKKYRQMHQDYLMVTDAFNEVKSQLTQLQQIVQDYQKENEVLKKDRVALEQEAQEKAYQMVKLQEMRAQMEFELKHCLEKLAQTSQRQLKSNEETQAMQELEKLRLSSQQQWSAMEAAHTLLKQENDVLRKEASKSVQELMSIISKCNFYQEQMKASGDEVASLKQKLVEMNEKWRADEQELAVQLHEKKQLQQELQETKERNKQLLSANETLLDKLDALQRKPFTQRFLNSNASVFSKENTLPRQDKHSIYLRRPSSFSAASVSHMKPISPELDTRFSMQFDPSHYSEFNVELSRHSTPIPHVLDTHDVPKENHIPSHSELANFDLHITKDPLDMPSFYPKVEDTFIVEEKKQSEKVVHAFTSHIEQLERALAEIYPPK